MLVVEVAQFGGPEVLQARNVPDPVVGPGQVAIGVAAVDTLFLETAIRSGRGADYFGVRPPYVPGGAVAGEVISVGAEVDSGWMGRRVLARTANGAYTERVVVPAERLVPVPEGLGLREAAALAHDGATATGLAEAAPIQPGTWVLVTAAAGGMGVLLLQLARTAGARVIAAARGQRKLDLAREVGAEVVIDYSDPGWAEKARLATGDAGPKVVFDGAGGELGRAAFAITATGGWFSGHGTSSGGFAEPDSDEAQRRGITVRGIGNVQFAPADVRRLTERALVEAASGQLSPVIGQTFPLDRAAEAHAAIEARAVLGKALLLI